MILIPGEIPIYILRMFPNNLVDKGDRGKKIVGHKNIFLFKFFEKRTSRRRRCRSYNFILRFLHRAVEIKSMRCAMNFLMCSSAFGGENMNY